MWKQARIRMQRPRSCHDADGEADDALRGDVARG